MAKKLDVEKKKTEEIVDPKLIEDAVEFINEKANKMLYHGSIEIGEYILKNIFHEDVELASSRSPKKSASYHQLCQSPDLAVPVGTLSIMVRVAAQERFFKENEINTEALSYTHKAELVKLGNNNIEKEKIIKKCIKESLSTRELSELVMKERKGLVKEYQVTPLKYFAYIDRVLKNRELPVAFDNADKLEKMKPGTRNELKKKTKEFFEELKTLSSECESLLGKIEEVEKIQQVEKKGE